MNKKPTLCIVAGPNGSGKTSTTIQLLENEWSEGSIYINPDNIANEEFGDWNSPDAILKAAKRATEMRYSCLESKNYNKGLHQHTVRAFFLHLFCCIKKS